jgi:hypothetical protein
VSYFPVRVVAIWCIWLALTCALFAASPCRRTIPIGVLDDNGAVVTNLAHKDFEIEAGKVMLTPVSAELGMPSNVVLLLDSGPNMNAFLAKRRYQLEVAYFMSGSAPERSAVTLVIVGGKIDAILQGRKAVQQELEARMAGNDPKSGNSHLEAAVTTVVGSLANPKPGDVIFALTSGDHDTDSGRSRTELIEKLQSQGVRVFYFMLDDFAYIGGSDSGHVPDASGGETFRVNMARWRPKSDRWKELLVSIMYRFYRVEIELPESMTSAADVHVKIPNRGKVRILAPERIHPCSVR